MRLKAFVGLFVLACVFASSASAVRLAVSPPSSLTATVFVDSMQEQAVLAGNNLESNLSVKLHVGDISKSNLILTVPKRENGEHLSENFIVKAVELRHGADVVEPAWANDSENVVIRFSARPNEAYEVMVRFEVRDFLEFAGEDYMARFIYGCQAAPRVECPGSGAPAVTLGFPSHLALKSAWPTANYEVGARMQDGRVIQQGIQFNSYSKDSNYFEAVFHKNGSGLFWTFIGALLAVLFGVLFWQLLRPHGAEFTPWLALRWLLLAAVTLPIMGFADAYPGQANLSAMPLLLTGAWFTAGTLFWLTLAVLLALLALLVLNSRPEEKRNNGGEEAGKPGGSEQEGGEPAGKAEAKPPYALRHFAKRFGAGQEPEAASPAGEPEEKRSYALKRNGRGGDDYNFGPPYSEWLGRMLAAHPRFAEKWTPEEEERLKRMYRAGKEKELEREFGRPRTQILAKLRDLGEI